jgi:hypothetical protein
MEQDVSGAARCVLERDAAERAARDPALRPPHARVLRDQSVRDAAIRNLQRQFAQAFDRQTGARPNPSLGAPDGYTLGKSIATQGGDLSAYYIAAFENNQDFWDPECDRGPASNDVRHRLNASFIYELPGINNGQGVLNGILGGWELSGITQFRTGQALRLQQPSGIDRSRPDIVPGVDPEYDDWRDRCDARGCIMLNPAAFARVPVSTVTNATLRPGTDQLDMARGPSALNVHMTVAQNLPVGSNQRIQVRADCFNLLNSANYNNPELRVNNADFGRITSASGSRVFQFDARLTF